MSTSILLNFHSSIVRLFPSALAQRRGLTLDSIAASLFENNWLNRQIVADVSGELALLDGFGD